MDVSRARQQPIDFRKEEVGYVMQRWRAADSCSLIGVGSVGKSNLLQHLANPEVQKHYLQTNDESEFKAIIIDPNMLGPLPDGNEDSSQMRCWAGYELMMHRLFMAFYPFEVLGKEDAQRFYDTYQALQDGTNPLYAYMGLRYFELGLDFFMRRGIRIVFMFDEFEDMLKNMPIRFFQTLRGLRDANKRQLSYLTFTRAPLNTLVENYEISALEIEPFTELFTDAHLYVGPYNPVDAGRMIENLMKRNQKQYTQETVDFLAWATGNYAGLLRSGFRLLDAIGPVNESNREETLRHLAMRRPIRMESKTLWLSLTPIEQEVLKAVALLTDYDINSYTEQAVAMLVQKRLLYVDKDRKTLHIQPPVFRAFVETNPDVAT